MTLLKLLVLVRCAFISLRTASFEDHSVSGPAGSEIELIRAGNRLAGHAGQKPATPAIGCRLASELCMVPPCCYTALRGPAAHCSQANKETLLWILTILPHFKIFHILNNYPTFNKTVTLV